MFLSLMNNFPPPSPVCLLSLTRRGWPLGHLGLSDHQARTPSQDYLSGRMAWADDKSIALGQFQHLAAQGRWRLLGLGRESRAGPTLLPYSLVLRCVFLFQQVWET